MPPDEPWYDGRDYTLLAAPRRLKDGPTDADAYIEIITFRTGRVGEPTGPELKA